MSKREEEEEVEQRKRSDNQKQTIPTSQLGHEAALWEPFNYLTSRLLQ